MADTKTATDHLRVTMQRYDVKVGPVTHMAAERERLNGLTWQHFDAKQLSATIGAVISGVDLTTDLAEPVIAELRQALLDYKVLFFRDQPLTPAQHVAFARRFGELAIHPFIPANTGQPELVRFAKSADARTAGTTTSRGGSARRWARSSTPSRCRRPGATRSSPTCTPPTRASTPSCGREPTSSSRCTTTRACSATRSSPRTRQRCASST